MSKEESDQMMELLKELALLKEMDGKSAESSVSSAELESRRKRRGEILEQIKAMGGPIG